MPVYTMFGLAIRGDGSVEKMSNRGRQIERVKPMLLESYDLQIAALEQRRAELTAEANQVKARKARLIGLRNEIDNNLSRCADSDLAGIHFLFFGRETP